MLPLSWQGTKKSWETAFDADSGSSIAGKNEQRRRKATLPQTGTELIEKGLVRYVYLILDQSAAMEDSDDMQPSRRVVTRELVLEFIDAFFEENPLSYLGILASYNNRAVRWSGMSGS